MENEEIKYFKGDYTFLDKTVYQHFKPEQINGICCADLMLNVLYPTAKVSDFIEPISKLAQLYNCEYYKNLLAFATKLNLTLPLIIDDTTDQAYDIVLRYIESHSNYVLSFSTTEQQFEYDIYVEKYIYPRHN